MTMLYSPRKNGVIERWNQTMVGAVQSMLKAKDLLIMFGGEAVATAVYILNRSTTKGASGKTP
jgi:hypothetical protein